MLTIGKIGKSKAAGDTATKLPSRGDSESKDERHAAGASRRKSASAMDVEGKKRGRGVNDLQLNSGRVQKKARIGGSSSAARELVEKGGDVGKSGKKRKWNPLDGKSAGESKRLHTDTGDTQVEASCASTAASLDEATPADELEDIFAGDKLTFAKLRLSPEQKEEAEDTFHALCDLIEKIDLEEGGVDSMEPESLKAELLKRLKDNGSPAFAASTALE